LCDASTCAPVRALMKYRDAGERERESERENEREREISNRRLEEAAHTEYSSHLLAKH